MNFWNELTLRLKSESPKFFKKIRAVALYWLGGFGAAYGITITKTIDLPDRYEYDITSFLSYAVVFLIAVTGGTFLPTINKTIIREQAKEDIVEKTKDVIKEKVEEVKHEDLKK